MGSGQTTKTDIGLLGAALSPLSVPALVVAYHPEPHRIGRRCVIPDGEPLQLGRGSAVFGAGTLVDSAVSRQHAELRRSGATCMLVDQRSHNGTFVNGERVEQRWLELGDVVTVGPTLLLFRMARALPSRARDERLVGVSDALALLVEQLQRAARQQDVVLLTGETGVGKELVAAAIHEASGVPGPLVSVNCGAISDGVVHSELFGHARGAFSGAERGRQGLVRAAAGGTLFLDEVGDASPGFQASLLRLLEQREFRPVGSDQTLHTDARFIAATHVALEDAVEAGRFRRDLHNRLLRWPIRVLPLRERLEDVIPLVLHFAAQRTSRSVVVTRATASMLLGHGWPGNVRELRGLVERAVAAATTTDGAAVAEELVLLPHTLGPLAQSEATAAHSSTAAAGALHGSATRAPGMLPGDGERRSAIARPSPDELRARLAAMDGNVNALATSLGTSRRTAYRWLEEAGIDLRAMRSERGRR